MTTGGWISMILSVGSVTALFGWCVYRVLRHNPPAEPVLEDALHDVDEADRS